jgi:hypothetical protein
MSPVSALFITFAIVHFYQQELKIKAIEICGKQFFLITRTSTVGYIIMGVLKSFWHFGNSVFVNVL